MIPSNVGYAERFLAAQNNEISSNRSAQSAPEDQEFVWERGRKLSADTNKRRRRQEQKQRREADSEEKRRQEILEQRRQKLKEATEKYQKCRGTRKAVEKHHRSSSATRHDFGFSNRELEETLRLLQGSGGLHRYGSHDGLNGRLETGGQQQQQQQQQQQRPPQPPPHHQKPPPSGGATASFLEKYGGGSGGGGGGGGGGSRPLSSTSDSRGQQQQQNNHRSIFEQQLADFQQKKWESQKRSVLDFQQDLESTLRSAAPPAARKTADEEFAADEDPLNDSLDSARTYDRLMPAAAPATAPAAAPAPQVETFESFDSTAALRPELFRPAANLQPEPLAAEPIEPEPRSILKKQTSYSSDGGNSAVEIPLFVPPQPAQLTATPGFSEARAGRLRDSVEISRVTLHHQQHQEQTLPTQQQQQQQDEASRKKSVRFAETLFEEQLLHPHQPEPQQPQAHPRGDSASSRPSRPTSGRPVAAPRAAPAGSDQQIAASGTRMQQAGRSKLPEATPPTIEPPADTETPPPPPSPTNGLLAGGEGSSERGFFPEPATEAKPAARHRVEVCLPDSQSSPEQPAAIASAAAKPPVAPAPSGPGYVTLMSKKPPKPYKPRPRPVKVTSSTLNRLVASPQSGAEPVPPNVAPSSGHQKQQQQQQFFPQPQLRSGPLPKRTVSDPNLSQQQQQQQQQQPQQPISLDRTPTDQEIDFLWTQVRECLNRSTSSLATESDASVRSAPVPRALHQPGASQLLIDGSNLMALGGSARSRGVGLPPRAASAQLLQHRQTPAGRFLQQHQLVGAQQRRLGLAGAAKPPAAAAAALDHRPPLPPSMALAAARPAFGDASTAAHPHQQHQQLADSRNGGGAFAPVSDSLAEFLANEMALSSVDGSASSSPRGSASGQPAAVAAAPPVARPGSSVRRGVMLRHREQNSPLSLNLMSPPSPTAPASEASTPAVASRQPHQSRQPSQLSLEEQRLMKSLDRLNNKLGSDR